MCFYCFMPRFMHAGITTTCIFSSFAHKCPAHLFIIGGAFLLESIIWCTRIVRCSEFGGCPLFGSSKCIESTGIAVGASTAVRYTVDIRYWECLLMDVPLYYIIYNIIWLLRQNKLHLVDLINHFPDAKHLLCISVG